MELGDKIVKSLGQASEHDLLANWMARYLAEKMTQEGKAQGSQKAELGKECFELVLKIWDRRHSLPDGTAPLGSFKPLFDALKQLSADGFRYRLLEDVPVISKKHSKSKRFAEAALAVDQISGSLIRYMLSQAIAAVPEKEKQWLKLRKALAPQAWDIQILRLVSEDPVSPAEKAKKLKKAAIEDLQETLRKLEAYTAIAGEMKQHIQTCISEAMETC